jgi:hypothetical protein
LAHQAADARKDPVFQASELRVRRKEAETPGDAHCDAHGPPLELDEKTI